MLNPFLLVLIVDMVAEVLEIQSDQIETMHNVSQKTKDIFISGLAKVEQTVKILINVETLLFHGMKQNES